MNAGPPARLSRGDLSFLGIDPELQALLRRMWANRFAGFHTRDIGRYLGLDRPWTRYQSGGRTMTARGFRRRARLLFVLLAVAQRVGVRMTAEQLDAEMTRDGERLLDTGVQLYMLHGWPFPNRFWMFRQSRMRVWFAEADGVWVWAEAIETPLERRDWVYSRVIGPDGEEQFIAGPAAAGR